MTASRLGDVVGVSESAVVRFANALNYQGIKTSKALQELIRNKLQLFSELNCPLNWISQWFEKCLKQICIISDKP